MHEYETEIIKLMKQIAEDIHWLRQRQELTGYKSKTMRSC